MTIINLYDNNEPLAVTGATFIRAWTIRLSTDIIRIAIRAVGYDTYRCNDIAAPRSKIPVVIS